MSALDGINLMRCSITVTHTGSDITTRSNIPNNSIEFYTFPEEINSSLAAVWSEQTILGRVGTIAAFAYTQNKTTSFTLPLHREMMKGGTMYSLGSRVPASIQTQAERFKIETSESKYTNGGPSKTDEGVSVLYAVGRLLSAACMPVYTSGGALKPPVTTFKFGQHMFRGRVTSVGERWSGPMVGGYYSMCEYSISMTEMQVNSPTLLSANDVPVNWYNQNV